MADDNVPEQVRVRLEKRARMLASGADPYPVGYPRTTTAAALREFFNWALSPQDGNSPHFMKAVGFVALPAPIVALSKAQVAMIH